MQSDALNSLEQTHDFKDDQFDYIQQTLRCICMKCKVLIHCQKFICVYEDY